MTTLLILTGIVLLYANFDDPDRPEWAKIISWMLFFILICVDLAMLF